MAAVEVRESGLEGAGGGLFASTDLPANTYIVPYKGAIITRDRVMQHGYNRDYVLLSGSRYVDAIDPGGRLVMDDGRIVNVHKYSQCDWHRLCRRGVEWRGRASLARFVNHGPRSMRNVAFRTRRPYGMGFITTRAVGAGEELLTDYGSDYWKTHRRERTALASS